MNETIETLRWKKFPVLSDGFVCLVDVMGDDSSVVQAARVSFGKDARFEQMMSEMQTKDVEQGIYLASQAVEDRQQYVSRTLKESDRNLIRYLMRHRHTTPFEMAEIKLLIRCPMDCWRQWIRHRTASVNEYSTRYTEAIDSMDKTPPDQWRLQSTSNKQGSGGFVTEWPDGCLTDDGKYVDDEGIRHISDSPGEYLCAREREIQDYNRDAYQERLKFGVAREQARKDLPLSTYTEAYWKINLHNLLHFLSLRMDSHAQKEIRDYATIIGEQIVKPLFPVTWEAFVDYRLNSVHLSGIEVQIIKELFGDKKWTEYDFKRNLLIWPEEKCRERDECIAKLKRLGLIG